MPEEYPNFSLNCSEPIFSPIKCNLQTDVIGISLSCHGIFGFQNITLVLGIYLLVSVHVIMPPGNSCAETDNSQYCVDNSEGQNMIYIVFISVLTSKGTVVCGGIYHLRIGVSEKVLHQEGDNDFCHMVRIRV